MATMKISSRRFIVITSLVGIFIIGTLVHMEKIVELYSSRNFSTSSRTTVDVPFTGGAVGTSTSHGSPISHGGDDDQSTQMQNVQGETRTEQEDAMLTSWWRGRQPPSLFNATDFTSNGARHPNGTLGMIVDPSPERLHFPKEDPTMDPSICPLKSISTEFNNATTVQLSFEGEAANIVLQKIRRGVIKSQAFLSGKDYNQEQQQRNASVVSDEETVGNNQTPTTNATSIMAKQRSSRSRILCMIYTFHIGCQSTSRDVGSLFS